MKSVQFSEWTPGPERPIIDLKIAIASIPELMSIYSKASSGKVHRIDIIMKVISTKDRYRVFTDRFSNEIFTREDEAVKVLKERCTPQ